MYDTPSIGGVANVYMFVCVSTARREHYHK